MRARAVAARRLVGARRGSALILVLVAMVVLLVLVSGAMFGSMQEVRTSRNAAVQQRALAVAEYGMHAQLANWPSTRNALANGAIDSTIVVVNAGDTARVRVQRLNARTFNVVSIGRAAIGNGLLEAQRQTSMLVRVSAPAIKPLGVLTVNGAVEVKGSPVVNGANTVPTGWTDCATFPTTDTLAIAYPPGSTADVQKANQTVGGGRPMVGAGLPETYAQFGQETWSSLAARAGINLAAGANVNPNPVGSATSCTFGSSNWGEPYRGNGSVAGCQAHFPIIHAAGDLDLQGNTRGQGILIVEGKLRVRGTFEFYGLILVGDEFEMEGTADLFGAVMVRNSAGRRTSIQGNAVLNFSHCAVGRALAGLAVPRRTGQRSWAQIF